METTFAGSADAGDRYLTTKQVSRRTGIPEGTLRYWRSVDQGPASFALTPKRIVYRESNLQAWLVAQETATTRGGVA